MKYEPIEFLVNACEEVEIDTTQLYDVRVDRKTYAKYEVYNMDDLIELAKCNKDENRKGRLIIDFEAKEITIYNDWYE